MAGGIVVADYHKGNLLSVVRSLADVGGAAGASDDPTIIRGASGIVLPGVGSFEDAMLFMSESGQSEAVLDAVGRGVPFLGICLGLQLLFERGDERVAHPADSGRWARGLGVLHGSATRLASPRLKVPHVGWDQLELTDRGRACPLFAGVAQGANVYFTHSFALGEDVEAADVAGRTHYVRSFASAVWHENVYGVQFHPEKSSKTGLGILTNYVRIVRGLA